MSVSIVSLDIPAVKRVVPKVHRDPRGYFCETYSARDLAKGNIDANFVQDNHSLSTDRGVIRGLHFQTPPHAQGKLVRVVKGAVFDVAVDLREGSPTFGRHVFETLTAENFYQLWVPPGFAHGFCTLEDNTEVVYKVTDYYAPECDYGLAWNDPALGIDWPVKKEKAILSEKDNVQPLLADLKSVFTYSDSPD